VDGEFGAFGSKKSCSLDDLESSGRIGMDGSSGTPGLGLSFIGASGDRRGNEGVNESAGPTAAGRGRGQARLRPMKSNKSCALIAIKLFAGTSAKAIGRRSLQPACRWDETTQMQDEEELPLIDDIILA
jgi:hypothetical protein